MDRLLDKQTIEILHRLKSIKSTLHLRSLSEQYDLFKELSVIHNKFSGRIWFEWDVEKPLTEVIGMLKQSLN
jgi:hypothetical protein